MLFLAAEQGKPLGFAHVRCQGIPLGQRSGLRPLLGLVLGDQAVENRLSNLPALFLLELVVIDQLGVDDLGVVVGELVLGLVVEDLDLGLVVLVLAAALGPFEPLGYTRTIWPAAKGAQPAP